MLFGVDFILEWISAKKVIYLWIKAFLRNIKASCCLVETNEFIAVRLFDAVF